MNELLLATAKDVSVMMNLSVRSIWRMRNANKMPAPIRLQRAVRWNREEIRQWIADGCPLPNISHNNSRKR